MKKVLSVIIAFAIMTICFSACKPTDEKTKFSDYSFDFFDTVTTITGFEKSKEDFDLKCDEIKKLLSRYHKLYTIYSRFDGVNNLTVVNETSDGEHKQVVCEKEIIELLEFSKEIYDFTGGAVNVAMGSVLSLWHNAREEGTENPDSAKLPEMIDLLNAKLHTNIDKIVVDSEKSTVFLSDPEMRLDVGAIAKGYAVEQVAKYLEDAGTQGYLLNVGGNIRIVGKRPDGKKWKIGVENPDKDDKYNPYIEYLELDNYSIVTSGSYQRYYVVDGKKYHHIIDPETLMPANKFESVSIVSKDSGVGDALSTALFILDYEEGKKLVESTDGAYAMWVLKDGEKLYSKGFTDFISNK